MGVKNNTFFYISIALFVIILIVFIFPPYQFYFAPAQDKVYSYNRFSGDVKIITQSGTTNVKEIDKRRRQQEIKDSTEFQNIIEELKNRKLYKGTIDYKAYIDEGLIDMFLSRDGNPGLLTYSALLKYRNWKKEKRD